MKGHLRHGGLVVLAGSLILTACSGYERVSHRYPGSVGQDLDLSRWVRGVRIYNRLDTVALTNMTLLSDEFQQELRDQIRSEVPGRNPEALLGFPVPQTAAAVVVIISGSGSGWEAFGTSDSPWSLVLQANGRELLPSEYEALDPTVSFERYFPAWNPWSRAWLIRFDAPAEILSNAVTVKLRAPGRIRADLRWP